VRFETGDAMELREDLSSFDLVHAANLLCRLPEPVRFLKRLRGLVNTGGSLVLATPATWMDAYTPRGNQPTGLTLDFLKSHLDSDFELRSVTELPFLIREHRRKLQLSTSQTSVWVKR
jgi:SAM-dependent methyltransferase